jgi:glycyl-tRNA synthetase
MRDIYEKLVRLAKRRGFFYPSFEIYGGASGFQDWGPLGCSIKTNLENLWRNCYIHQEGMAEIECPTLTPYKVLKASGHVDKFLDERLKCRKCGRQWRPPVGERCPECGGELISFTAGLMFETKIGRDVEEPAYLRPETAQGIFLNFLNLYRHFRKHLPFGVCQIGKSYRNELSPRKAVLRLKEFSMMEAEVFFDPNEEWPSFDKQKQKEITLLPSSEKYPVRLSLEKAVDTKIISSKPLAYYLGITHDFLLDVGIDPSKMRFRQHRKEELAHYAKECWDAEAYSDRFGWVELAGIANRTTHDLKLHSQASGTELSVEKALEKPKIVEVLKIQPQMGKIGSLFKEKSREVRAFLEELDPEKAAGDLKIKIENEEHTIPSDCYKVVRTRKKVDHEKIFPHVIEPSYGTDRIIYLLLEHAYRETEKKGERYSVLGLKPLIAPVKVGVFPLIRKDGLPELAGTLDKKLKEKGMTTCYDEAGSIGKRYARMDEIGTPFCVTVDYQSLEDDTVTLRDRDTTRQVRIKIKGIGNYLKKELNRN